MKKFYFNWLILFYTNNGDGTINILHEITLEDEPAEKDLLYFRQEVETTEEFGMVGVKDYELLVVSRYTPVGKYWFDTLGLPEFVEEEE